MPRSLIEAHICGWQAKCWLKSTLAADESVAMPEWGAFGPREGKARMQQEEFGKDRGSS